MHLAGFCETKTRVLVNHALGVNDGFIKQRTDGFQANLEVNVIFSISVFFT